MVHFFEIFKHLLSNSCRDAANWNIKGISFSTRPVQGVSKIVTFKFKLSIAYCIILTALIASN